MSLYFGKATGIILLLIPLIIERITTMNRHTILKIPSLQDMGTVSYAVIRNIKGRYSSAKMGVRKVRTGDYPSKIKEILEDLPRHSSINYINEGSLTEEYFKKAESTLNDNYIYIIVSNTGSAASELLSVFTQKQYNHVSLSFDRELETIISYNGGERVFPPGLNNEMIEFFNKKEDASIVVYKLATTKTQKKELLEKVREINDEGSAYNLLGIVFKYSHKPNIMFCSQFVYTMLKSVGLEYFDKKAELVQPTDLVELDYYRKLEFEYEIKFN